MSDKQGLEVSCIESQAKTTTTTAYEINTDSEAASVRRTQSSADDELLNEGLILHSHLPPTTKASHPFFEWSISSNGIDFHLAALETLLLITFMMTLF